MIRVRRASILARAMIIAIDGPSGAGKSTVSRRLAERLGAAFMDTGAMYRAVAEACLREGIALDDERSCADVARAVRFEAGPRRSLLIDGAEPSSELRTAEVTAAVSQVSAHPVVRELVVEAQRRLADQWGDVVAEGRDMTTVVFPQAALRIYLEATVEERARRRAAELGTPERIAEIRTAIERRDDYDSRREIAPLRRAPGQTLVVTDGLEVEQVVDRLEALARSAAP